VGLPSVWLSGLASGKYLHGSERQPAPSPGVSALRADVAENGRSTKGEVIMDQPRGVGFAHIASAAILY